MYFLFTWLKNLFRFENIKAIMGSLKRRLFRLGYLEMRLPLSNASITQPLTLDGALEIKGYSESFKKECICLLNSVGSLGFWNQANFEKNILSSAENPKKDIFALFEAGSLVGFTIIYNKSLSDSSAEVGYVAVRPKSRGKKFGYRLLMYVLSEMKARGLSYAYLRTDSFRIPAIKTYLKCGFYPYIKNENEEKRWRYVMDKIKTGDK